MGPVTCLGRGLGGHGRSRRACHRACRSQPSDRWPVLVVVILLLFIVFLKGTSPGGSRAREEFQASKDRGSR
jgi:hypothetical protein